MSPYVRYIIIVSKVMLCVSCRSTGIRPGVRPRVTSPPAAEARQQEDSEARWRRSPWQPYPSEDCWRHHVFKRAWTTRPSSVVANDNSVVVVRHLGNMRCNYCAYDIERRSFSHSAHVALFKLVVHSDLSVLLELLRATNTINMMNSNNDNNNRRISMLSCYTFLDSLGKM